MRTALNLTEDIIGDAPPADKTQSKNVTLGDPPAVLNAPILTLTVALFPEPTVTTYVFSKPVLAYKLVPVVPNELSAKLRTVPPPSLRAAAHKQLTVVTDVRADPPEQLIAHTPAGNVKLNPVTSYQVSNVGVVAAYVVFLSTKNSCPTYPLAGALPSVRPTMLAVLIAPPICAPARISLARQ